jgi:hypothetical protein
VFRSLLPPDASFDADGCLSYRSTPGFADLFRQWLDRYAKPVDGDWHDLFLEVLHVSNEDLGGAWIDDVGSLVWLTAPGPSADDGTPDPRARLCRLRFEEGRAGPVTDAMEKAARCLADSPSAALVHPRFAFPPARYKRIVTIYRNAACALDGAGVVTCCGPGAHPFAPERRFTWIGASTTHLCAVETSGNAFCRDLESWAPEQIMGRYARYEIHGAPPLLRGLVRRRRVLDLEDDTRARARSLRRHRWRAVAARSRTTAPSSVSEMIASSSPTVM